MQLVHTIIDNLKIDPDFNYGELANKMDEIFYMIFNVDDDLKEEIEFFTDDILARV